MDLETKGLDGKVANNLIGWPNKSMEPAFQNYDSDNHNHITMETGILHNLNKITQ